MESEYVEPKISRISVDGQPIGVRDLHVALDNVRRRSLRDESDLRRALVEEMRNLKNYMPESAETKYEKALLREYRRYLGEPAEEDEQEGLFIRILGRGCPNCRQLTEEVMAALSELGLGADVEHVTDINEIAEYGAVGRPALVINEKIKSVGRIPGRGHIKQWLQEEMRK